MKDTDKPTVVHIHTEKGHGFTPAVENKEAWHYGMPFNREDGSRPERPVTESYEQLLSDWLLKEMKQDKTLVAVQPVHLRQQVSHQRNVKKLAHNMLTWVLQKNRL